MLDSGIKKQIIYELRHYIRYKSQLERLHTEMIMRDNLTMYQIKYINRIKNVCEAIDISMLQMKAMQRELIQKVYIHKIYGNIQKFSIEKFIDVSTGYRLRSQAFEILAKEMGYVDNEDMFKEEYKPLRGW